MLSRIEISLSERPGTTVVGLDGARHAAVAVVIRPNLDIAFIRRAEHEKDPWSGHMALPGGRVEPSDASVEYAARRETHEEIGVDLSQVRCLGQMNQVASPALTPRVVVTPFVFALEFNPEVRIERSEVASVHWFGIERLRSGEGRATFDYQYGGRVLRLPCIDLDGQRIWGMTLRIVDELIERLTP